MKVTPNPMCSSCENHTDAMIDGFAGPVGHHDMCITPVDPFVLEGYTALSVHDEYFIDGFENMRGECKFYKRDCRNFPTTPFHNTSRREQ